MWSAVNLLTNGTEILDLTDRDVLELNLFVVNGKLR